NSWGQPPKLGSLLRYGDEVQGVKMIVYTLPKEILPPAMKTLGARIRNSNTLNPGSNRLRQAYCASSTAKEIDYKVLVNQFGKNRPPIDGSMNKATYCRAEFPYNNSKTYLELAP